MNSAECATTWQGSRQMVLTRCTLCSSVCRIPRDEMCGCSALTAPTHHPPSTTHELPTRIGLGHPVDPCAGSLCRAASNVMHGLTASGCVAVLQPHQRLLSR